MHLIQTITLKSGPVETGQPLEFQPASVNLFVGPNNSAKAFFCVRLPSSFNMDSPVKRSQYFRHVVFATWTNRQKVWSARNLFNSHREENLFRRVKSSWGAGMIEPNCRQISLRTGSITSTSISAKRVHIFSGTCCSRWTVPTVWRCLMIRRGAIFCSLHKIFSRVFFATMRPVGRFEE